MADIDDPRPIVGRDRFRIGSVTKVYTAAVVMQLIAEGAMSLGDTVERWLPGLVPDAEAITVELLLRLRSGLPDYVGPIFGDPPDLRALGRYWSPEALVRAGLSGPDRLAPDTEFRYSNTDYVLLGLIVEKCGTTSAPAGRRTGTPAACRASSVARGTVAGRSIVLWQNCFDAHRMLTSDAPFIRAALSA